MIDTQTDRDPILVYDPASDAVGSYQSEFYTSLWSTFDVDHTDSVEELCADATTRRYVAVVYRWRTGTIEDLEAILARLPEPFSIPFLVAGPDDPTAVRNVLVTAADGYVPAGPESAAKLEAHIDTETPISKTAGAETVDTSELHAAIVEQMQDTAWVLDRELGVSYINDRLVERLDLAATDIIGQPLAKIVDRGILKESTYGRFEAGVRELLAGKREQFRIQLTLHPDGGPTYTTDVLARPYRDSGGEIVGIVGIGRDITEQLAEQRRMERQNDLFRQAEQLANIGGWAWDLTDNTVEVTDEVYTIYDLPETFDPTIENMLQYHPDPTGAVGEAVESLREGEPADLEARLRTPEGDHKWVRIHGSPKRSDGEVTEIIGSVQDITERRRLETQLRDNVDSLRELYQLSADTSLSFPDRIERVLELTCERLGLSYGFLTTITDDLQQVVYAHGGHDRIEPGWSAPLAESYCRKTIQQEALFTLQDATSKGWTDDPAYQRLGLDCYLGGSIKTNGRLYGTLWFADDDGRDRPFTDTELAFVEVLTKWVSYHLERQSTESKLRELQETTQAFLTADDEEAVTSLAMEAATDILELPLTALWQHDEESDALLPVAQTDQSDSHFDSQPRFESGDGPLWTAYATNSVVVDDDVQSDPDRYGHDADIESEIIVPVQSYGVLVSATREQRSFSDLEVDLHRILAASVSAAMVRVEREAELQRQNDRLSEFTGYVSHDLRNPLSVAQGYIDQIKATGNTERLAAVERAHNRMETLIEDMLLLARKGEIIDMVGPTNVERVAQWAWESVESRDAELILTGELTVEADAPRLQQVFENLFRNSVEHGGPELTITVECHDDRFVIADDGHGFEGDPPQLHSDTHESEPGLGLSIVAKIVEAHGWEITAQDGDNGGSRFEITGVDAAEKPTVDAEHEE